MPATVNEQLMAFNANALTADRRTEQLRCLTEAALEQERVRCRAQLHHTHARLLANLEVGLRVALRRQYSHHAYLAVLEIGDMSNEWELSEIIETDGLPATWSSWDSTCIADWPLARLLPLLNGLPLPSNHFHIHEARFETEPMLPAQPNLPSMDFAARQDRDVCLAAYDTANEDFLRVSTECLWRLVRGAHPNAHTLLFSYETSDRSGRHFITDMFLQHRGPDGAPLTVSGFGLLDDELKHDLSLVTHPSMTEFDMRASEWL